MAMIEFVRDFSDLSTDRGYQFQFRCDHCSNGYMSSFEPSMLGAAGGLLEAAGSIFGGLLGNAGNSAYSIQRAIGGPAHDRALQQAVAEVKQKFHRCQRCGHWVCNEICWNEAAAQCVGCTPKYEQEVISLRTQAQVQATQQQLQAKALSTDYVSGIDMHADTQVHLNPGGYTQQHLPAENTPVPAWAPVPSAAGVAGSTCACGAPRATGKFCPECGAPAKAAGPKTCSGCGHVSAPTARFCEDCGSRLE